MPHPFLHAARRDSLLVPGEIRVSALSLPCSGCSSRRDENGRLISLVLGDPSHPVPSGAP